VSLPRAAAGRAVLALGLTALAAAATALDPSRAVTQYRRQSWNTREGLPQSAVESLAQGYLWLGTQEGLARFDGIRFAVFDKAGTPALRHNRIRQARRPEPRDEGHGLGSPPLEGAAAIRYDRFIATPAREGRLGLRA
jgi:hypothetical protein